jgi:hypothetical protein
MIAIEFPYRKNGDYDVERIPSHLLRAIHDARERHPRTFNREGRMRFDQLFCELYNCRIEYQRENALARIVWDRESDYTAFVLRWS